MSLVLLSLAALGWGAASPEPTIQCGSDTGPSPEWMAQHTLTPGDLRELRVEPVKSNVQSYSCVRCNYTEAFQTQTRPCGGKWAFSYTGFPVELNTLYFIGAHNIPNANMNDDSPSMSVNFTSPGSLWDPNITACKKNETTVEVNFTTSPLGNTYMALIKNKTVIGLSYISENKLTRASVAIPVSGESEGAVVQLTPYFQTCGNDCIRRKGAVVLCLQAGVLFPLDNSGSMLGGWLPLLLGALLMATWVLAAGVYLMWRHDSMNNKAESIPR
ncbi:hypothetical protein MC885_000628 [Smutsia gigantea]|nr:hypothetical protein MC885_000628 [Smutsia gigantea]